MPRTNPRPKPTKGAFGSKSRQKRKADAHAEEEEFLADREKALGRLNIANLKAKTHA